MKIPETAAPSYYGEEPHWQGNGMIAEPAGQYSGVAGTIPTPVYPQQIRGHIQPGYLGMGGAYYPVFSSSSPAAPSPPHPHMPALPLGAPPHLPLPPHPGHPPPHPLQHPQGIDFSEYMWMENEEEFDKQVMQQLEEEALMEQCIEAMMEDERERVNHRHNGRPNGVEGRAEASKSTLNPLAAEFVPGGGGGFMPCASASTPSPLTSPSPSPPPPPSAPAQDTTPLQTEECPVELKSEAPREVIAPTEQKAPSEIVEEVTTEDKEVEQEADKDKDVPAPELKAIQDNDDSKFEEVTPAIDTELTEKSPVSETDFGVSASILSGDKVAWKEQPSSRYRRKPAPVDVGKKPDKGSPLGSKLPHPKISKSDTALPPFAKGIASKQVKSEPKFEQKSKENSLPPNSAQDKPFKEELMKQTAISTLEGFAPPSNHMMGSLNSGVTQPAAVAPPKPINYAAAAKANRPQPRTLSAQPAAQPPAPSATAIKKTAK